jgi:hypothetical protein|nr:MAG TPA: hypothetical protein [Caudoviricetes sp.]
MTREDIKQALKPLEWTEANRYVWAQIYKSGREDLHYTIQKFSDPNKGHRLTIAYDADGHAFQRIARSAEKDELKEIAEAHRLELVCSMLKLEK